MQIQLLIEVVNGQLNVKGPVHDKMLCYGLLEAAKDAVRDYKPQPQGIEVAGPGVAKMLARSGNGNGH